MIRTETEYKRAVQQIDEEVPRIELERDKLRKRGLSNDQIKRAHDPARPFHE